MGYIGTKPANAPVTSDQIGDGVIQTSDITDNAITTVKIADSAVTNSKIADSTIGLSKLSATGTKDSTTFLRGDNTFATVSTTPADGSITDAKVASAVTGSSWFSLGSIPQSNAAQCFIGYTQSAGSARLASVRVLRTGTYSIRLRASSSTTSYYRIYKNGVALSTELSVGGGYVTISWSGLAFTKGDLLQLYGRTGGSSGVTSFQASCDSATTITPIGVVSANEGGFLSDNGIAL